MDSKDVLLGVISLGLTVFGTYKSDITTIVFGLVFLFLTIQFNLDEHDQSIKELKAQINTQRELQKIWRRLERIENENKTR